MNRRVISGMLAVLVAVLALTAASATAQTNPVRPDDGAYGPSQPLRPQGTDGAYGNPPPRQEGAYGQNQPPRQDGPGGAYGQQPGQPQVPRFIQRPAEERVQQPNQPPQPPPPPFTLTPEEQAQVDQVLNQWEAYNHKIKKFECSFKRWVFNVVFAPKGQLKPQFVEEGIIKYGAPDKGLFRLDAEEVDGKKVSIPNDRAEYWLCDGESIYQYVPAKKRVEQHRLPPELQGKAIANSPLPFLFGAEAANLKQRYFIRLVQPPTGINGQIWLEACPRNPRDAANFTRATFIIAAKDMSPLGLELIQPNAKDFVRYRFDDVLVNARGGLFPQNPFKLSVPWGWQLVPDPTPQHVPQAQRMGDGRR
ncbi:MAG: hypothetical protein ABFC96_02270 [Thermoguttaceae bacterium]